MMFCHWEEVFCGSHTPKMINMLSRLISFDLASLARFGHTTGEIPVAGTQMGHLTPMCTQDIHQEKGLYRLS
jgi:hypothetical protein